MGFPESIAAYPDVRALFEKADGSEKGLQLTFSSPAEAVINAGRINAYRQRLRRENAKTYPADHPLHNRTEFDHFMVRHAKGSNIVKIEKLVIERFNIEELK